MTQLSTNRFTQILFRLISWIPFHCPPSWIRNEIGKTVLLYDISGALGAVLDSLKENISSRLRVNAQKAFFHAVSDFGIGKLTIY